MKNLLAVLFALFSFCSLFGQKSYTLEEAIQYALQNNNQLKKAQLEIQSAEGQIKEYKSIGIPKVSAGVDYQYFLDIPSAVLDFPGSEPMAISLGTNHSLRGNIQASSLLFDGSYLAGLKAQKLYKELVVKQITATEFEIKNIVTKAYLSVLIATKNIDIYDLNIKNVSKSLKETTAIFDNGFAEKLDVERLELSLSNLKVERENVARLVKVSLNLLKFQMGYPLDQGIKVKDDIDILVNDALINNIDVDQKIDFQNRPEYQVLKETEVLRGLQLKTIKRGAWPSLNAFASHEQSLLRNNLFSSDEIGWFPTTLVGLGLKVPIFDGLERKGNLQKTQVEYEKLLLDMRSFERAMIMETNNAKIAYLNAQAALKSRIEGLELADKIYTTTKIKYKEGVGSSFEVTQAESALYTSQAYYVNALYELLVAKTDLEKAWGNQ